LSLRVVVHSAGIQDRDGAAGLVQFQGKRTMPGGILGSGLMGGKLGTLFAHAGHEVVFSYARSKEKLKKLARDAHGKALGATHFVQSRADPTN
jgi:hypothetical protein